MEEIPTISVHPGEKKRCKCGYWFTAKILTTVEEFADDRKWGNAFIGEDEEEEKEAVEQTTLKKYLSF